jgi:Zn-dependent M16 (insulinase) family peptidase
MLDAVFNPLLSETRFSGGWHFDLEGPDAPRGHKRYCLTMK